MSEKITIKKEDLEKLIGETVTKELDGINKSVIDGKITKEEASEQLEEFSKKLEADNEKKINDHVAKVLAERKTQEIQKGIIGDNLIAKNADGGIDLGASRVAIEKRIAKSEKAFGDPQTDYEKELSYHADKVALLKNMLYRKDKLSTIYDYGIYKDYIGHVNKAGVWDETTGDGSELVPTVLSNRVIEDVLAIGGLMSFIPMETMPKNFEIARLDDQMQFFNEAIVTATAKDTPTTAKATFSLGKIMGHGQVAYEQEEDSITSAIGILLRILPINLNGALEQLIISGDNSSPHFDADIEAVVKHSAKTFKGVRRLCIDNSWTKSIGGKFVAGTIETAQAALHVRSSSSFSNLGWVFGGSTYAQARQIASVRTQEVIAQATNQGPLNTLDGSKVMVSEFMREDVNSSGENAPTAADNTKAGALLLDKRHFLLGRNGPILVETDRVITSQLTDIVISTRMDMKEVWNTAKQAAVYLINITKS